MISASSVLCLVLLGAELCAVLAMPKLSGEAWAVTCSNFNEYGNDNAHDHDADENKDDGDDANIC